MKPGGGKASLAARLLLALIDAWRWAVSPFYAPCCRFHPTCSSYCRQAVLTHGAVRGCWLGLRRLLRCHPFGGHGWDPVPPADGEQTGCETIRR